MTTLMHKIRQMENQRIINPPQFVLGGCQYMALMGSVAYGCNDKDKSDLDLYGITIPPKAMVFPHLTGEIEGFGTKQTRFGNWQQHHVVYEKEEYDFDIFNIVKFFHLAMQNNPNVIDALFVPERCVLFKTEIGDTIRFNRKIFLHKGSFHKFRGYAFSQLKKAKNKQPEGKRKELVDKYGFDTKFLYHIYRLADEAEQILMFGDIDITRSREMMKAVRRGDMSLEEVEKWFFEKERHLEKLYHESNAVPYQPDEAKIKQLLLNCLEQHYGSLEGCIVQPDKAVQVLRDIRNLLDKNRELF